MKNEKLHALAKTMHSRALLLYRQLPFYQRIFLTRKAFLSAYLQGVSDAGVHYVNKLKEYSNEINNAKAITAFIRGFSKGFTEEQERITNSKEEKTIH